MSSRVAEIQKREDLRLLGATLEKQRAEGAWQAAEETAKKVRRSGASSPHPSTPLESHALLQQ